MENFNKLVDAVRRVNEVDTKERRKKLRDGDLPVVTLQLFVDELEVGMRISVIGGGTRAFLDGVAAQHWRPENRTALSLDRMAEGILDDLITRGLNP